MDIFEKNVCKNCIVVGEYLDEEGNFPKGMCIVAREFDISLKKNNVKYHISSKLFANRKIISITSDKMVTLGIMYELLMDVVWFENLFEGRFFPFVSFKIDDNEMHDEIKKHYLGYFSGSKKYIWLPFEIDNKTYKKLFGKFIKQTHRDILRHQVFLNASYLTGMTVDVRMALLLEIFEPIADEMSEKGTLELKYPAYITFNNVCKVCGSYVSKKKKNKEAILEDKIRAVMKLYGKDIFKGESQAKIAKKAVGNRNKVDHVSFQKNSLAGNQCGFYLCKYALVYRVILLEKIGVPYQEIQGKVIEWTEHFNNDFPELRIFPYRKEVK